MKLGSLRSMASGGVFHHAAMVSLAATKDAVRGPSWPLRRSAPFGSCAPRTAAVCGTGTFYDDVNIAANIAVWLDIYHDFVTGHNRRETHLGTPTWRSEVESSPPTPPTVSTHTKTPRTMTPAITAMFLMAVITAVFAPQQAEATVSNRYGPITFYGDSEDSARSPQELEGACGFATSRVSEYYAAASTDAYENSIECGTCLRIDYRHGGATRFAVVEVVDECLRCNKRGIDVSLPAMTLLLGSTSNARTTGIVHANYSTWSCDDLGRGGLLSEFLEDSSVSTTNNVAETSTNIAVDIETETTATSTVAEETTTVALYAYDQSTVTATPEEIRVCARGTTPNVVYVDQ